MGKHLKLNWGNYLAFLLAILFLYLSFRNVNLAEILDISRKGQPLLLFMAFFIQTVSYILRALRWRVLLTAEGTIHPIKAFWGSMTGYLGNSILPARAGEIIRTVTLSNNTGLSKTFILGTILVERGMDVVALAVIGMVALTTFQGIPGTLTNAFKTFSVIGLIAFLAILLAPRFEYFLLLVLKKIPFLSDHLRNQLREITQKFLTGLRSLQSPGRSLSFIILTGLIWLNDGIFVILVGKAFYILLSLPQSLLLLASLGLSSAIPSTPGYVGVYQFVAVIVLTPFGFSQSQALTLIITVQVITYFSVILWGLIGLWRLDGFQFIPKYINRKLLIEREGKIQ